MDRISTPSFRLPVCSLTFPRMTKKAFHQLPAGVLCDQALITFLGGDQAGFRLECYSHLRTSMHVGSCGWLAQIVTKTHAFKRSTSIEAPQVTATRISLFLYTLTRNRRTPESHHSSTKYVDQTTRSRRPDLRCWSNLLEGADQERYQIGRAHV